jgi:hypothetical protein
MGSSSEGSTNAVDQLLGHTKGPKTVPDKQDAVRLEYSREIVDINFTELTDWCDDMHIDGYIYLPENDEYDIDTLRVNIFTDIHNYLSSLYSLVEELRQILNECVEEDINKDTIVRGSSRKNRAHPPFIRKLPFAWGLRNQFTHGNYRCLTITQAKSSYDSYLRVEFHKQQFDPRGKGDLQEVGDYLWGVDKHQEDNPMCYFADLNDDFVDFWSDTADWFERAAD